MVNLFVNSEAIAVKRVVLATVMSAALLGVWGTSAQAGSLTPAQQKVFEEIQTLCRHYGQGYEDAAKIRDGGLPVERFLRQMMDDNTVTPERYKELVEIVLYVYERPTLPPDFLGLVKERECWEDVIKNR